MESHERKRGTGPLTKRKDAIEIARLVRGILIGEPVQEQKRRLIAP
jgi:hypothetical protein